MLEINLHRKTFEQYGRALIQKKHRQEGNMKEKEGENGFQIQQEI